MKHLTEVSDNFSLEDFLAYLFPGWLFLLGVHMAVVTLFGVYSLVDDGPAWLIIGSWIVGGYFLGVVSSQMSGPIERLLRRTSADTESPASNEYLQNYLDALSVTFASTFGFIMILSRDSFYAIRAYVRLEAPTTVVKAADRQNSLRQIRRNSLIPAVVLILDGCIWALSDVRDHPLRIIALPLSVLSGFFVLRGMYKGMQHNRKREVRDYCLAFLSLHGKSNGNK